jgi:hypothetical protein
MLSGVVARCAVGAAVMLSLISSAWAARVLHAPGGGAVRALVIGIDKYPNLDKSGQLSGAKADADDIAGALEAVGVPRDNVRELPDSAAVRSRVIAEMDRLVAQSKSGDLAIIAYSGHGMRVRGYQRWEGKNRNPFHSQMALANFSPADDNKGHEVIVDAEMRAWYYRLDAKGVDIVVVMDTCYGGHMREIIRNSGGMTTRQLNATVDDRVHDSFVPIQMKEAEAGADANAMRHLTFFAGASDTSMVPEMSGIDRNNPTQVRGALSYFIARVIDGRLSQGEEGGTSPGRNGPVTRGQLFRFLSPVVREATDARQIIDYGPRTEDGSAQQQAIFIITDDGQPASTIDTAIPSNTQTPQVSKQPEVTVSPGTVDAVRLAISNGDKENFAKIEKGRAPFVLSEPAKADVIWDVANHTALSSGDLIMEKVDGSVLGRVIDRTWAVREIKKLAVTRVMDVKMGENGRSYTLGELPKMVVGGVRDTYLTVVNIAADGTLQLLFPFYPSDEPHMLTDQWTHSASVDLPFGTDYTVVIATSAPAQDLVDWLRAHKRRDAFELPAVLTAKIAADDKTRLGTAGLFTHAAGQ